MTIFNVVATVARPTQHLSIGVLTGLLVIVVLLSACQPSDSVSADQQNNLQGSTDQPVNNDGVSAVVEDDLFSDIVPTYADAPTDEAIASGVDVNRDVSAITVATACQNETLVKAFKAQQSDRQVKGCGTIIKTLPDDNDGSRHQKILVELEGVSPKQTVLLVHNIDLAPRVAEVSKGTSLSFYGEYVYNNKGGLVHWTHHDPAARHQGGWIDSNGVRYQ
ncbi:hypothetical protein RCH20_001090 [Psychrobacter sp. PL15]|uniref:DUF3465 domain-containing protein n=1 Tax=Psychrobacter sp. PL15 TaxID=3071719 RepID=UPI002DFD2BA3|nr:hypothetical protein [Psychrobacter sp. PL15]